MAMFYKERGIEVLLKELKINWTRHSSSLKTLNQIFFACEVRESFVDANISRRE